MTTSDCEFLLVRRFEPSGYGREKADEGRVSIRGEGHGLDGQEMGRRHGKATAANFVRWIESHTFVFHP